MNLPQAIVDAVTNDPYSKGDADFSVTQLLKPSRAVELERRHAEELTEDVSDRIYSLQGQAMHVIAERANMVGIAERRLSMSIMGIKISGGMDLYLYDDTLIDYKNISVWKLRKKDFEDWKWQLNIYAELLRQNGDKIKRLQVIAFLRDWHKYETFKYADYPQTQVALIEIELLTSAQTISFIADRIRLLLDARKHLPECTDKEMWAKPSSWAVKKNANIRAEKGGVYESEAEAKAHAAKSPYFVVEHRPGVRKRCLAYCLAAPFCDQYKTYQEKENEKCQ